MCDESSAQIESAFYRQMSLILELLCDEFTENDLLGEVLAPHDDVGLPTTSRKCGARNPEQDEGGLKAPRLNPARISLAIQGLFSSGRKPCSFPYPLPRIERAAPRGDIFEDSLRSGGPLRCEALLEPAKNCIGQECHGSRGDCTGENHGIVNHG